MVGESRKKKNEMTTVKLLDEKLARMGWAAGTLPTWIRFQIKKQLHMEVLDPGFRSLSRVYGEGRVVVEIKREETPVALVYWDHYPNMVDGSVKWGSELVLKLLDRDCGTRMTRPEKGSAYYLEMVNGGWEVE